MSAIKAWLITGSNIWADSVVLREQTADLRMAERNSRTDRKVPLVEEAELSSLRELVKEMREALGDMDALCETVIDERTPVKYVDHPIMERVLSVIAKAAAILKEEGQ